MPKAPWKISQRPFMMAVIQPHMVLLLRVLPLGRASTPFAAGKQPDDDEEAKELKHV